MGCDIHTVIERRVAKGVDGNPDKWVAVAIEHEATRGRNYERFAALAGVRGDGPEPRGMPEDASDSAALLARDWAGDGHSHSWLPVEDAAAIYLATDESAGDFERKYPLSHYFWLEGDDAATEHRIVFWFDN